MVLVLQPVEDADTLAELVLDPPPPCGENLLENLLNFESSTRIKLGSNLVPVEGAARELAVPLHPDAASIVARHHSVR